MEGYGYEDELAPDVVAGAAFGQSHVISQVEGLQDFRRRQEGHLIMCDDRPLLVMSFGTKYEGSGDHKSKYKIEGKYDIPCGYKVIVKWHDDEIVFMTRQGTYGPEFQIIYLPKSPVPEDFTLLDWNPNSSEIWNQLLNIVENKESRDLNMFKLGPWKLFGVTLDEVQIALKQGIDNKTVVEGILRCANGQEPDLREFQDYLGYEAGDSPKLDWISQTMQHEPLPTNWFQYPTKDGQVYWVDASTNEPTWKHPHFDKYKRMLYTARTKRLADRLFGTTADWKPIMEFRVEFLLNGIFTWECEASGEYPPVETIENVIEMARIMWVNIEAEPYLVHVLKRALRHYGNVVKEKRSVGDVEDFRFLMQRYRDLVGQFERAKEEESRAVHHLKLCVACPEDSKEDAVLFCDQCKDLFCRDCFTRLHSKGRRQQHRRTWVELTMCAECQDAYALFHCTQCSDVYCRDCFQEWHIRGGRRNHVPIILRSLNSQTDKLPQAKLALGTVSAQSLAKAKSPWFSFNDESNVVYFYNIESGKLQRDMPLAPINEPVGESIGGGIGAAWGGSFGAGMFPDPIDGETQHTSSRQGGG